GEGCDRGGAARGTDEERGQKSRFAYPTRPRLSAVDTTGGLMPQAVTFSRAEICVKQWRKPLILCRQAWLIWKLQPFPHLHASVPNCRYQLQGAARYEHSN